MIECQECKLDDVYIRQEGKFRRIVCVNCEQELRPNGQPVDKEYQLSSERLQERIREDITEQYSDLLKDTT